MAPTARSRPVSATTIGSSSTNASTSSYFTDQSGVPGLDGVPKGNRPLPDLLNLLVDAAHTSHDNKKLLHPPTSAYSLFNWRVANASQQPPSLATSKSVTSAGHSSMAVYAWGDAPQNTIQTAEPSAAALRASQPAVAPSGGPARSRPLSSSSASATTASPATPATAAASNPVSSSATTSHPEPTVRRSNSASSGSGAGATTRRASLTGSVSASASGGAGVGSRRCSGAGTASGGASAWAVAAVPTTSQGIAAGAPLGAAALPGAGGGTEAEAAAGTGAQLGATASSSRFVPGGMVMPREIARPAVVARALAPWEGAELEVICLYDSNFQTANCKGQHGVPLRVPAQNHIGPVSYLYRWYCKRSTQFRGEPPPEVLREAPAMPPPSFDPRRPDSAPAAAKAASSSTTTGGGSSTTCARSGTLSASAFPSSSSSSSTATSHASFVEKWNCSPSTIYDPAGKGSGVWRPPRPSASASGGIRAPPTPTSPATSATAGGISGGGTRSGSRGRAPAAARSGASGTTAVVTRGRCLNLAADPVISLSEVVDMLEDLEVVPQMASRLDIKQLFEAACQAAALGSSPSASSTPTTSTTRSSAGQRPVPSHHTTPYGQSSLLFDVRTNRNQPTTATTSTTRSSASQQQSRASRSPSRAGGARSASAPRAPSGAASSRSAGTWSAGNARGGSGAIPRPQVHPEEIRFPVFKDLIVRLAVAIKCTDPPYTSSRVAAAAATVASTQAPAGKATGGATTANTPGSSVTITPRQPLPGGAAAAGPGGVTQGCERTMSYSDAVLGVRRLLEHMGLYHKDLRGLRNRLDELTRFAAQHSATAQANKRRHVAVPSPVAAAQGVTITPPPAAGAAALPPPGHAAARLAPWGVLSFSPAPSYLLAVLAEEDRGDDEDYRPAWREFGSRALELGVMQPGEWRQCRLMLHSRGPHTLTVRLDASDAPFCRCSHQGLHSVPPGMPLRLNVAVRLSELGETVGELRLYYSSSQDRREREVIIPVYGIVCPPGAAAAAATAVAGRTWPTAPSERSALAVKSTREAVPREVVIGAMAAAPLGHLRPRPASAGNGGSGLAATASQTCTTTLARQTYTGPRKAWSESVPGDGSKRDPNGGDGGGGDGGRYGLEQYSSLGLSGAVALDSAGFSGTFLEEPSTALAAAAAAVEAGASAPAGAGETEVEDNEATEEEARTPYRVAVEDLEDARAAGPGLGANENSGADGEEWHQAEEKAAVEAEEGVESDAGSGDGPVDDGASGGGDGGSGAGGSLQQREASERSLRSVRSSAGGNVRDEPSWVGHEGSVASGWDVTTADDGAH